MAATLDHVEQLVDTVYNSDSVVSRVMSDSELAVKCLGTTADHINRYNEVVQYGIIAWCCIMPGATLWVGIFTRLGDGVLPLCIVLIGLMMVARIWLDYKVKKIVEDKLGPKVKKLQASIMELKTASGAIAATWYMGRVEVLTWENYQCMKSQKATIAAIDSVATDICLLCTLLREKRCLIAEQVLEALPPLKNELQSVHEMTFGDQFADSQN